MAHQHRHAIGRSAVGVDLDRSWSRLVTRRDLHESSVQAHTPVGPPDLSDHHGK